MVGQARSRATLACCVRRHSPYRDAASEPDEKFEIATLSLSLSLSLAAARCRAPTRSAALRPGLEPRPSTGPRARSPAPAVSLRTLSAARTLCSGRRAITFARQPSCLSAASSARISRRRITGRRPWRPPRGAPRRARGSHGGPVSQPSSSPPAQSLLPPLPVAALPPRQAGGVVRPHQASMVEVMVTAAG